MKEQKFEYQLPLVTIIYLKEDIVTTSMIGDEDDEIIKDQDWGI